MFNPKIGGLNVDVSPFTRVFLFRFHVRSFSGVYTGPFFTNKKKSLKTNPPPKKRKKKIPSYIWMFPKIVGFLPNHPINNRVFQYFHHPFRGENPYFWEKSIYIYIYIVAHLHFQGGRQQLFIFQFPSLEPTALGRFFVIRKMVGFNHLGV